MGLRTPKPLLPHGDEPCGLPSQCPWSAGRQPRTAGASNATRRNVTWAKTLPKDSRKLYTVQSSDTAGIPWFLPGRLEAADHPKQTRVLPLLGVPGPRAARLARTAAHPAAVQPGPPPRVRAPARHAPPPDCTPSPAAAAPALHSGSPGPTGEGGGEVGQPVKLWLPVLSDVVHGSHRVGKVP